MKTVNLTYFKKSGKYYSESSYVSYMTYDFEIYSEVREMGWNGKLPGLSTGGATWGFMILVEPQDGTPALVYEKDL